MSNITTIVITQIVVLLHTFIILPITMLTCFNIIIFTIVCEHSSQRNNLYPKNNSVLNYETAQADEHEIVTVPMLKQTSANRMLSSNRYDYMEPNCGEQFQILILRCYRALNQTSQNDSRHSDLYENQQNISSRQRLVHMLRN